MRHLGDRRYPVLFPLVTMILFSFLVEFFVISILHDPAAVGTYAIFPFVALIIYFAFRSGLRGGFIAAGITILFYLYIIYTLHYTGEQLRSGLNTTAILGFLYLLLGGVIGWLKQRIDILIDLEAGEKRRLQAIIQQLPVGVLVADREGRIEHGNKQVEEILGRHLRLNARVGKDSIANGRAKNQLVKPAQWPLARTLATGKSISGKEFVIEREDGKKVYLEVSAAPIHNREGKMVAAASVLTDMTQQKLMEERKDDFINMASHELKTPLTSMLLYLQLLKGQIEKRGDDQEMTMMGRILDQTERLQSLVRDLLDVSRIQTGKLTFHKEKVRIDTIIEEIVEVLQKTTSKQKIIILSKKPLTVYADTFRLYQVLTNLITNAIKYSGTGKEIRIKAVKKGNDVIVSVQDFGVGISKDQQKKIFDRLYQAVEDRESTFPGFGMGLFIAKEIVERHNGKIWVDSEKGKGSIFYFSLPTSTK